LCEGREKEEKIDYIPEKRITKDNTKAIRAYKTWEAMYEEKLTNHQSKGSK
jgi:hypothetical protein